MKKVTNTAKSPSNEWLLGGNPNAIEAQEAQGQKELVEASQLPRSTGGYGDTSAKDQYELMGIKVIGETEGDELFFNVELPEGWKLENTDHAMWNKLVDDKGRERAMIFYKAAFYDRSFHISFNNRFTFSCTKNYPKNCNDTYERINKEVSYGEVKDCGSQIFKTEELSFTRKYIKEEHMDWWSAYEKFEQDLRTLAENWINEKYPNHKDVNAYWD